MDQPESSALPGGLRQDWPVPRQLVLGERGGALAWIECQLVLGTAHAVALLPDRMRNAFVAGLARFARRVDKAHTRAAEEYLRQALGAQMPPEELSARVLQAWKHLIGITLDAIVFERRVPAAEVRSHFTVELCPEARELLARREGCVMISAHVGDWESGPAILPWLGFDPLYAITKAPRNRWLSMHLQLVRESRGMRVFPRRGAMEFAPAIVRAGGTVILLLDQRARLKPILVPFFGRVAKCDRSASVLIRRLRAPLVFAACYRTEKPFHFRLAVPRVVRPEEVQGLGAEEVTALVNAELEKLILAAPEQYFWLHDRWR